MQRKTKSNEQGAQNKEHGAMSNERTARSKDRGRAMSKEQGAKT
jgi:hypothetical protein